MAILKDCVLFYPMLNPARPNKRQNPENPTWEVQIRTNNPNTKKSWEEAGARPKLMVYKEGHENEGDPILDDDGKKQWMLYLRRKTIKKDGTKSKPVDVVDAALKPLDPDHIGNGSIANIRVFQYQYTPENGKEKTVNVLMGVQIRKLIVYTPKERSHDDDFEQLEEDTEIIAPELPDGGEGDDEIPF